MKKRPSNNRQRQQWKIYKNDDIKAFTIMLIDEHGENVGRVPRAKALSQAEAAGMDLVQLSYDPKEKIATAKIVDYGKYMYDQKRKDHDKRMQQKAKPQKEIKFGYNIGDHDLDIKMKRAIGFLKKGHNVKIMVVLRGREKAYKELVREKFEHIEGVLGEHGKSQGIKGEQFGFTLLMAAKKPVITTKKTIKKKPIVKKEPTDTTKKEETVVEKAQAKKTEKK